MAERLSMSAYSMACSNSVAQQWPYLVSMQKEQELKGGGGNHSVIKARRESLGLCKRWAWSHVHTDSQNHFSAHCR